MNAISMAANSIIVPGAHRRIFALNMNEEPDQEILMRREELSKIQITKTIHVPALSDHNFSILETYLLKNLDLEVKWISKSDRLISVTGYEDQVNDANTMLAILKLDDRAAMVPMQ